MRGWQRVAAVVVTAAAIGGGVYAWGEGALRPCGLPDRIVHASACRRLAVFDDQDLIRMIAAPDGALLAVSRQPGLEPQRPQQLLRIDPQTGLVRSRVALAQVPPGASWVGAAASPSGRWLAGLFLDGPIQVVDTGTGATRSSLRRGAARLAFVSEDALALDPGVTFWGIPDTAPVVSIADEGDLPARPMAAVTGLVARGISVVQSPDGAILAEHVETRGDSGVVAIRLADAAERGRSSLILAGALDVPTIVPGLQQLLPELAFSPDGRRLAASFGMSDRWGHDTTALFVWEVEGGRLLRRIASRETFRNLVWSADSGSIAATRYTPDSWTQPVKTGVTELVRIDIGG
jgi:hypothetical protein